MYRSMTTGRRMLAGVAAGALGLTMIPLVGAAASSAATPADSAIISPAEDITIVISGSRDGREVMVEGGVSGMEAYAQVRPMIKLPGETVYTTGRDYVDLLPPPDGAAAGDTQFNWQRKTNKKIYVYFRTINGEFQSKRVIIAAR
jgi:hypothetical protein